MLENVLLMILLLSPFFRDQACILWFTLDIMRTRCLRRVADDIFVLSSLETMHTVVCITHNKYQVLEDVLLMIFCSLFSGDLAYCGLHYT